MGQRIDELLLNIGMDFRELNRRVVHRLLDRIQDQIARLRIQRRFHLKDLENHLAENVVLEYDLCQSEARVSRTVFAMQAADPLSFLRAIEHGLSIHLSIRRQSLGQMVDKDGKRVAEHELLRRDRRRNFRQGALQPESHYFFSILQERIRDRTSHAPP